MSEEASPPVPGDIKMETEAGQSEHGSEAASSDAEEQVVEDPEAIAATRTLLSSADYIMEPGVTDTLIQFMHAGGDVDEAVELLSSNYAGYAQIVNLMADWLVEVGTDVSEVQNVVEDHLHQQVVQNFNTTKANEMLLESEGVEWLPALIAHRAWRDLVYRLSDEHPDCLLLNFAIKLISDAGYQEEISSVSTASNQLEIFSRILCSSIDRTLSEMENSVIGGDHGKAITELGRIACQSEHTYLYAQSLIFRLMQTSSTNNALKLRRMFQEICAHAESKGHDTSAFTVLFHHCATRKHDQALLDALHSMLVKRALNPADIRILYNRCLDPKISPAVELIREPMFVELLVDAIFRPSSKLNPEYESQYIFLLAYAGSVSESFSKTGERLHHNREELEPTQAAIAKIHDIISSREVAFELLPELGTFFQNMRYAVVSQGVFHWVKCTVMEPDFFKLHREPTPLHLALVDEVVNLHPLLHVKVFEFFTELFLTEREDIETLSVLELRKMLIDRIVHLLTRGFALPVISFMKERLKKQDTDVSLLRYFASEVLDVVGPPFDVEFVREFKPLVEDRNVLGTDSDLAAKRAAFLDACASAVE